jgi:hypothetical protein
MTLHAMEEMAEDNLDITDIEQSIFSGSIVHTDHDDPRGAKHVIHGNATDPRIPVGVVGRFASDDRFLIITVFEISD